VPKNAPPRTAIPDTAIPHTTVELPARMRVHALAKLLGVPSKAVVAELERLGAEVRSVQSSIDKDVAEQVRTALAQPGQVAPSEPEAAVQAAPTAKPVLGVPLFLQPEEVTAPLRRRASRPAAAPTQHEVSAEPVVETPAEVVPSDAGLPSEKGPPSETAEDDDDAPKRRRRGRRGRGRGRGPHSDDGSDDDAGDGATEGLVRADQSSEEAAVAKDDAADTEDTEPDSAATDDAEQDSESSTGSRRRRRRRRKGGNGSGGDASADEGSGDTRDDDPPNTVVHEREARSRGKSGKAQAQSKDTNSDQVQGITGSTRLEAKRQRRRDGRDAGRRRPAILSESEFLARREAVNRTMVVRQRGEQTQVAVLEDDVLVEHFVTSSSSTAMVGNIYLGRVQNVLPSMEAAFIDVGRGRNGVLYAGEVDWDAAGLGGKARKIEQALHSGDTVLVQVSKDPVGHKGARLTTQISLPGRFLVYVPGGGSTGISRKLPDTERKRLKEILKRIVPADAGVIIRTASEGVSEDELERDVSRLQAQWETISAKAEEAKAGKSSNPVALYEEPDLLVKVVRDQFNEDFSSLVVAGDQVWETVEGYVNGVAPELVPRLERHTGDVDVFTAYRIDEQLAKAMDRKVWLPSGGTLVIDRTEAMTVVDVNTGKFTGAGGNLEETVTRNNLEAAEEIVRQMRLRDIGGMIVVDFIDMVLESNRDLVLRRLTECLGRDRTRHQVSEVTSLGLVQMTRKRMGAGLIEEFSTPCEHCHGRGVLVQDEPVAPAEQDSSHADSGRRSRRPRGEAGAKHDADKQPAPKKEPIKEPWPAALIPASSAAAQAAAAHAAAPQPEPATPEEAPTADAPAVAASTSDASAADAPAPRRGRSRRASRPAAAPEAGSADTTGEVPDVARTVVVESEAAPAPQIDRAPEQVAAELAPAPRKTRARRASRGPTTPEPVSTPELPPTPVATPEPAAEAPAAAALAVEPAAAALAVEPAAAALAVEPPAAAVRPRRRRAAARPAGPPVDGDPV